MKEELIARSIAIVGILWISIPFLMVVISKLLEKPKFEDTIESFAYLDLPDFNESTIVWLRNHENKYYRMLSFMNIESIYRQIRYDYRPRKIEEKPITFKEVLEDFDELIEAKKECTSLWFRSNRFGFILIRPVNYADYKEEENCDIILFHSRKNITYPL